MRISCGLWSKIKGAAGRMKAGIKKGWNWVKEKVPQAVKWAREKVPKVIDTAKKVLNVLPQNKYIDTARKVVDKGEHYYHKADEGVRKIEDRAQKIHGALTS